MFALFLLAAPAPRTAPPLERPVHHILPRQPSHPVKLPHGRTRLDRRKLRMAKL